VLTGGAKTGGNLAQELSSAHKIRVESLPPIWRQTNAASAIFARTQAKEITVESADQ